MLEGRKKSVIGVSVLLSLLLAFVGWTGLEELFAANWVAQGNRFYQEGKYDEALGAYQKASVDRPEAPFLYFNEGNVFYKKGDYRKAIESLEKAALKAKDLSLEARANYNIGNCHFSEARGQESDPKKALEGLQQSIRFYRQALDLDPEMKEAAHNLEVARLLVKDLLDKIKKQQEEQQKQQEEMKKIVEELARLLEKQQKAVEENRQVSAAKEKEMAKEEGASRKEGLAEVERRSSALTKEQKEVEEGTRKLSKKMEEMIGQASLPPQQKQPVESPLSKSKQHLDKAGLEQKIASELLEKSRLAEAKSNQENSASELEKALAELLQGNQGQQDRQEKEAQEKERKEKPQPQPEQQDEEKRDEKARDILQEEKENQKRRERMDSGKYHEVEKDW